MFRIYYHLYLGPSWQDVWALHKPLLERFAASGLMGKLIICAYGASVADLGLESMQDVEIRRVSATVRDINEFDTLAQMLRDARDPVQEFDYCVYLHSKGSSSRQLDRRGAEWSSFLALALIQSLPSFERLVEAGYNSLGSNLALGFFEDFGPSRLHYSGNFWCATRELVASGAEIRLGERHTAVRHNAEWWLGSAGTFIPFNTFSTGVNHYTAGEDAVDWSRLQRRLEELDAALAAPEHSLRAISFAREMAERAAGQYSARRWFAQALLGFLPHHRWRRLLNLHDFLMRALGSRKSVYFYCTESR